MAKKTIPCRVCGKEFEPCAFCQSHSDTFRWRNFACSKECAEKYIMETVVYREGKTNISTQLDKKEESITEINNTIPVIENKNIEETVVEKPKNIKKKYYKGTDSE